MRALCRVAVAPLLSQLFFYAVTSQGYGQLIRQELKGGIPVGCVFWLKMPGDAVNVDFQSHSTDEVAIAVTH